MAFLDTVMNAYTKAAIKKQKPLVPDQTAEEICKDYYSEIPLDGMVCSDGTPCRTYIRKGNGRDLVIMINGGGMAWDERSCGCGTTFTRFFTKKDCLYTPNMGPISYFGTFLASKDCGIYYNNEVNPFASWDNVLIQYATGDFHVGSGEYAYQDARGKDRTMYFHGYDNFKAAMHVVKKLFPNPERILLGGGSAGAFGLSALAGEIIDMYPECKNITVYVDASILIRDDWKEIVRDVWKAPKHIADRVRTNDLGGDWLIELVKKYGGRAKILYTGSTQDVALATYSRYFVSRVFKAQEEDLRQMTAALRSRICRMEEEGAEIHYYICDFPDKLNGGTLHCVCGGPIWHEGRIEGVSPSEWVMNAVEGNLQNIGLSLLD